MLKRQHAYAEYDTVLKTWLRMDNLIRMFRRKDLVVEM